MPIPQPTPFPRLRRLHYADSALQGYAPGSWSQVAVERTKPTGRVVGVDVIPAQPPRGVSTIQGNFLSRRVRDMLVELLVSTKSPAVSVPPPSHQRGEDGQQQGDDVVFEKPSYVDMERTLLQNSHEASPALRSGDDALPDEDAGKGLRIVDVSDTLRHSRNLPFMLIVDPNSPAPRLC